MKIACSTEITEFNRLQKEYERIYSRFASAHAISTTALCILYSLYTGDAPCTQKQLCEDWGIPMQTINSCLKALEKDDIVQLDFLDGSRKLKQALPTQKGMEIMERIVAPMVSAENQAFQMLSAEERRLLLQITKKHAALLRETMLNGV